MCVWGGGGACGTGDLGCEGASGRGTGLHATISSSGKTPIVIAGGTPRQVRQGLSLYSVHPAVYHTMSWGFAKPAVWHWFQPARLTKTLH